MPDYILMTDSDSDLPIGLKTRYDIPVVQMPYTLNGTEYYDDLGQSVDSKSYYDAMRNGAVPTTSALNEEDYLAYFDPILAEHDLLFIAFSSQLSRTMQSLLAAREILTAKYPERKFIVVDTLSISGPQTLLVIKAHEMYRAGKSIEEVAAWLEANKLRAQAYFTVDDLKYLQRGGRISAVAATMGSILSLKPIIVESKEGKLVSIAKQRGRRAAVNYLVEESLKAIAGHEDESPVLLLHADVPVEAERLKDELLQKRPGLKIMISNVGPVIGAHCGPGTLAICFIGGDRPC